VVTRRRRAWADLRFGTQTLASGATRKDDILSGLSPTETKTVSRILIDVHYYYLESNENECSNVVDLAIGVVSKEAFDLETLPDPDNSSDYPQQGWVYVATQPVQQSLPTGGTPVTMWRLGAHFKADVRGQRKVDRGVLFLLAQNLSINNGQTVRITGRVRALCLT